MPRKYTQQTIEMMVREMKNHGDVRYCDQTIKYDNWYLTTICNEITLHLPYTINNREKGEFTAEL